MRRRTASQCSPRAAAAGAPSRSPYGTRGDVSWLSTRVRVEGVFCTLRVYGVLRNSRGLSPLALGAWRTGVLTKSLPVQGSCSGEIVIDNAGSWASTRSASTRSCPVRPRRRRLASPEQSRRRFREQLHRNVGFIRRGASSCTLPKCCGRAPVLTGFEAALLPHPGTVMRDAGCGLRGTTLPCTWVNRGMKQGRGCYEPRPSFALGGANP
jgi:hypothetical protein